MKNVIFLLLLLRTAQPMAQHRHAIVRKNNNKNQFYCWLHICNNNLSIIPSNKSIFNVKMRSVTNKNENKKTHNKFQIWHSLTTTITASATALKLNSDHIVGLACKWKAEQEHRRFPPGKHCFHFKLFKIILHLKAALQSSHISGPFYFTVVITRWYL